MNAECGALCSKVSRALKPFAPYGRIIEAADAGGATADGLTHRFGGRPYS